MTIIDINDLFDTEEQRSIRKINNIKKQLNTLTPTEANNIFHHLILTKLDLITCTECGEPLNEEIGDKCLISITLEEHNNDTESIPVPTIECPDCYLDEEITEQEWESIGRNRGWI